MNKSYSKLRHTNNTNYLLEQRYISEKRNRDLGVLSEQKSRDVKTEQIKQYCNKLKGGIPNQDSLAVFNRATRGTGWMSQSTFDSVKGNIASLSGKDLCATIQSYGTSVGGRDLLQMFLYYIDAPYAEGEVLDAVLNVLEPAVKEADPYLQRTSQFGCVIYKGKSTDGSGDYYEIAEGDKTYIYNLTNSTYTVYKNGQYYNPGGGNKNFTFKCDGDNIVRQNEPQELPQDKSENVDDEYSRQMKIVDKTREVMTRQENLGMSEDDAKKIALKELGLSDNTTPSEDLNKIYDPMLKTTVGGFGYVFPNVFTPNVVTDLRGKIGSTDTSKTLSQTDINLLYDKISKI